MIHTDLLLTGIGQLATPPTTGRRHGPAMRELTIVADAAVAISGGVIDWVGEAADWAGDAARVIDCGGRAVVPGLVDPHTHIVWAGDRYDDFVARIEGVPYESILARGGGIRSSVRATAGASVDELVSLAMPRLQRLQASGAATIEIKSGYGYAPEAELRSLEAINAVGARSQADVHPTLLIHIPPMNPAERTEYLEAVTGTLIPEAARRGLATAVDVFVEREAWLPDEAATIWEAAAKHGLGRKAHVDQFHSIGGLEMAIAHGALSVDHLEASGPAQIEALAASDTIGVVLPGVTLHLGIPAAPGRTLIDAGAAISVGTDCNPGSSPLFSMQQALALAVRINGLTPAESLTAGTTNAAAALGLEDRGALVAGARADLLVLDDTDWRSVIWTLGATPVAARFFAGKEQVP